MLDCANIGCDDITLDNVNIISINRKDTPKILFHHEGLVYNIKDPCFVIKKEVRSLPLLNKNDEIFYY